MTASPFGTIEPMIFSYGVQPVGTAIPRPPAINFDPRALAAIDRAMPPDPQPHFVYPNINRDRRDRKGDRLLRAAPAPANPARLPQLQRVDVGPPATTLADTPLGTDMQTSAQFEGEVPPAGAIGAPHGNPDAPAFAGGDRRQSGADIYFALDLTGSASALERWAPGAEPVMVTAADATGIKALDRGNEGPGGESVVGPGDVNRLGTPAQRLDISGSARAKAEKCLAEVHISRRAASRCAGKRRSRRW